MAVISDNMKIALEDTILRWDKDWCAVAVISDLYNGDPCRLCEEAERISPPHDEDNFCRPCPMHIIGHGCNKIDSLYSRFKIACRQYSASECEEEDVLAIVSKIQSTLNDCWRTLVVQES